MKLRHVVLVAVASGVGGYLLYQNALSEEQRSKISEGVRQVHELVARAVEQVKPLVDEFKADQRRNNDHANQEHTRRQWEAIGF